MSRSVVRFLLIAGLMLALGSAGHAQVVTGAPPFGSFGGGPDIINLANLNSHLTIPIINKAGRVTPFTYNLSYDSSVWTPVTTNGVTTWTPVSNWGWNVQTAPTTGYVSATTTIVTCTTTLSNWVFHDMFGVPHPFAGTAILKTGSCGTSSTPINSVYTDGSGYTILAYVNGSITITSRTGKIINPPFNGAAGAGTFTDNNGNQISVSSSGVFTDTVGTFTSLTVAGSGTVSSPVTFTYMPPAGGGTTASYTMNYENRTVATNFGVSGIGEYAKTTVPLVSSIVLPDGTSYTFTYEATPAGVCSGHTICVTGRIASVTLPTGGTISYTYSGGSNGIESDGSTAGFTRTTPDGTWTYSRVLGTGAASTTTIEDPQMNYTVLHFQGIYETQRIVYQGAETWLKQLLTCYNGNTTWGTCNSTAVTLPITQRTVLTEWAGTGLLQSETNTFYNSYGSVTEKDEYAYGSPSPGAIVRKTVISYASLGNGIVSMPAVIAVTDRNGNLYSQTSYTYDQGTVTSTSGTPNHVSVSGSRGNLTTISFLVGSTSLSKTYTYYDTGNVNTATDVNGAVTTYTYTSGACGNSFPITISEPMGLSRSITYFCNGAVATSVTDENGKKISVEFDDPEFWRPAYTKDQDSNTTNISYTGETSTEASLVFNSSGSTSDLLSNFDSLGRVHVSQVLEAPGSTTYDSVETDFDSLGRPYKTSLPYSGTAGQTNASAPGTTTTYDGLSRKSQVTDSGGRIVTFTYSQNDTYRTVSPAPTGENTKREQFEYDALGRLTSVCEITGATGSGTCGQFNTATGYWTTYLYDVANHLLQVTQNAQSTGSQQVRSYNHDDLGRIIWESNPESGATTYTFDTDTTLCASTSKGDLVRKIDAVGNRTCYYYDLLHRITSMTYSGPYASSTPNKYFVYDAATVNGVAMVNVKARLAEAYTATSSTGTKITDIGLSYSPRGEISDVYESTPNSGGYYHTSATYWANGALDVLTALYSTSNITGLPTFTYGPDGEGRISTVSASAGTNPVTSTAYSVASLPTNITFGSLDSDSFTYDPNTNRMTQYEFTVNSQSVVGALTWNPIGTLETLATTDPFYSAGNQTCTYAHDDLRRVASANCGTTWGQGFSYDAFGNITKTVLPGSNGIAFQPTYSYLTNQMTQVGSSTPAYDANGNATNDTAHTYSWDANGKPVTVDSVSLTYDAVGRMVEQNKSGVNYQIVYAPTGGKLAIMNSSTLQKAFVSLPGGSRAVYTSSGLTYYRHSDWIGSSRFASTPSRTMYYDGAYAPFGEAYAQSGTTDLSFTGMNQDTVPGLYDFPAREYNSIHGRWPSPDPAGISAVRLRDPQTWNRYAYVRNSPLHLTDPTGLCGDDDDDDAGNSVRHISSYYCPVIPGDDDDDDSGGGDDDGGASTCDDQCQQVTQAINMAIDALMNGDCGQVVDGGSGAALATLEAPSSPLGNVAGGGPFTLGTIETGPGQSGVLVFTQPNQGAPSIYGGLQSTIVINETGNGFFGFGASGPTLSDLGTQQVTGILHDLGHAAVAADLQSDVEDDSILWTGSPAAAQQASLQNNQTIADACTGYGDGGQNPGPIDDPGPIDAARKRTTRF
jgi:RHS repeat-associated protein